MTDHLERLFDAQALLERQKALERASAVSERLREGRSPSPEEELLRSVARLAQSLEQDSARQQEMTEVEADATFGREMGSPELEQIRRRLAAWLQVGEPTPSGMEELGTPAIRPGEFPMELSGGKNGFGVGWEGAAAPSLRSAAGMDALPPRRLAGQTGFAAAPVGAEQTQRLERRLRRDSRRYDSGFFLY